MTKVFLFIWIIGVTFYSDGGVSTSITTLDMPSMATCKAVIQQIKEEKGWSELVYNQSKNLHSTFMLRMKCIKFPE